MRTPFLAIASVAALAIVAGCSKPASTTANDTATAASNTADSASTGATGAGGAVSPPSSPENGAINTDANKTSGTQTPGSNSFTKSEAKGHIENAGYSDVTDLQKTADGLWTATAKKDGKTVNVAVDFKGAVTTR